MEDKLASFWIIPISFGGVSPAPRARPRDKATVAVSRDLDPAREEVYGHFVTLNITLMARKFSVQVPARADEEKGVFMSLCQRAEASPRLRRPWRSVLATVAVAALAGTMLATTAGAATHAVSSGQTVRASAPTATISVEVQDQGKILDNYYIAQAAAFNKANPGDHVTMDVVPTNNVYKQKLLLQLQGNNPPALFQTWGGGIFQQYITAKVVQPFGDAGQSDAGHPTWESDFLSSTLGSCTYGGVLYCMPFTGTQPVFFFYNKPLLAQYHLSFPTTTTQLIADVTLLAKHNVTAIALGNNGEWEGLMYLEYFTDREGGPQVFLNIQDNKPGAWSNPAVIKALTDIQTLVKDKAFEQGYDAIDWGTGFTTAIDLQRCGWHGAHGRLGHRLLHLRRPGMGQLRQAWHRGLPRGARRDGQPSRPRRQHDHLRRPGRPPQRRADLRG